MSNVRQRPLTADEWLSDWKARNEDRIVLMGLLVLPELARAAYAYGQHAAALRNEPPSVATRRRKAAAKAATAEGRNPDDFEAGAAYEALEHGVHPHEQEIHTLLVEAEQGCETGPIPDHWQARDHAEYVRDKCIEIDNAIGALFPDEDPEALSGCYGDFFSAALNALSRLGRPDVEDEHVVKLLAQSGFAPVRPGAVQLREFVEDLATQPCRREAEDSAEDLTCSQTNACFTEWCDPCRAGSLLTPPQIIHDGDSDAVPF